jgi:cytochrome c oxidase subunit 4
MKDFFENPALLIGAPMLIFGLIGAGLMILTSFAPAVPSSARSEDGSIGLALPPPGGQAHHGPGPAEYVNIGLVLAAITALEVAVFYVSSLEAVLAPILIVLSLSKFLLVVLFFMHLRFDNRLFSTLFTGGFALALAVFIVVLATLGASIT